MMEKSVNTRINLELLRDNRNALENGINHLQELVSLLDKLMAVTQKEYNLEQEYRERRWNRTTFSKEIGISYSTLLAIERGDTEPKGHVILKISKALDVDVEVITEFHEKRAQKRRALTGKGSAK